MKKTSLSLFLSPFSLIYFLPFWLGFFVSFPADVFDPTITPRSLLYTLASSLLFFLSVAARPGVIEKRCGWQSAERRRKRRKKRRETLSKRRKRAGCADACKDRDEQDAFGSCR